MIIKMEKFTFISKETVRKKVPVQLWRDNKTQEYFATYPRFGIRKLTKGYEQPEKAMDEAISKIYKIW